MEAFDRPGTHVILGKSGSGKTSLIGNIVTYLTLKKSICGVLLFSQTAKFNNDYPYIDQKLISSKLNLKVISWIVADREKKISRGEEVKNLLIILDDVVGDIHLRSNEFNALITRARHFKLYIILSIQHSAVVHPIIRENANTVSITKIDNRERIKVIYDLCAYPGTIKEFEQFMLEQVGQYQWFVSNRCTASKKISDQYKIIQTTLEIPKFKWV